MTKLFLRLNLALVIIGVTAISADAGNEGISPESDLARLQGKWTARAGLRREIQVALEIQGRRVDAVVTTPHGINLKAQGEVKIDETTAPRALDWIKFNGPDQQELPAILGIYKLDRETFVVCTGGFNGDRPTEFKSGEGVLTEVVTFRRPPATSGEKGK
ncbi:MAG: TIGR03067 domain-containing protein [Isosphaeraceae bacterium]